MSLPSSSAVKPGRQRRGRAARRAARRARQVPGVVGGAVDGVEALPVGQRHRHVGLAEDHRAGVQQALHRHRGPGGDVAAHAARSPRWWAGRRRRRTPSPSSAGHAAGPRVRRVPARHRHRGARCRAASVSNTTTALIAGLRRSTRRQVLLQQLQRRQLAPAQALRQFVRCAGPGRCSSSVSCSMASGRRPAASRGAVRPAIRRGRSARRSRRAARRIPARCGAARRRRSSCGGSAGRRRTAA